MWLNIIQAKLNLSESASSLLPLQNMTYKAALGKLQGSLCVLLLAMNWTFNNNHSFVSYWYWIRLKKYVQLQSCAILSPVWLFSCQGCVAWRWSTSPGSIAGRLLPSSYCDICKEEPRCLPCGACRPGCYCGNQWNGEELAETSKFNEWTSRLSLITWHLQGSKNVLLCRLGQVDFLAGQVTFKAHLPRTFHPLSKSLAKTSK